LFVVVSCTVRRRGGIDRARPMVKRENGHEGDGLELPIEVSSRRKLTMRAARGCDMIGL
jgi:hypothetical protein